MDITIQAPGTLGANSEAMSSLRTAIHTSLLAATAVTDLIGSGAGCRHYPVSAPRGATRPYVASQVIDSLSSRTHGPAATEDTLDFSPIQFTCVADTAAGALALATAIRETLLRDAGAVLSTAGVTPTNPHLREIESQTLEVFAIALDLDFFHNPST